MVNLHGETDSTKNRLGPGGKEERKNNVQFVQKKKKVQVAWSTVWM